MKTRPTLSIVSVILININIMFGTGIFINTLPLIRLVGPLGGLSYACIALLITPLVLCFSALIKKYPEGGLYTYASQAFGSTAGLISSLVYFLSKLASAALLLEVALQCLSTISGGLSYAIGIQIKIGILLMYSIINMYIFSTSRFLMYFFLLCKLTPIITLIGMCLSAWHATYAQCNLSDVYAIPSTLPLVLYAFTGFEACCSVSNFLKNPKKDAPKVLALSFGGVVGLTIVYQTIVSLQAGNELLLSTASLTNFFPVVLRSLSVNDVSTVLYAIVMCACLGGVYAILLSNYWNLYKIAQEQLIAYHQLLSGFNHYGIPQGSVIVQGLIGLLYIVCLGSNIVLLQQLSVMGCAISFSISSLALIKVGNSQERMIASAGFCTCLLICWLLIIKYLL